MREYYESYWLKDGGSPAEDHYELSERSKRLQLTLHSLPSGSLVLDAGCGHGEFSELIDSLGYRTVGVDISFAATSRAQQRCRAGFVTASLEAGLPLPDNTFQALWCTEVLEHVFEVHQVLAEFNRVLVDNGLVILTTPYHGMAKNLAITLVGFERHYNPYLSHIRFFTRKSLNDVFTRAGFDPISWGGIGRRFPFWMSHFVVAKKVRAPSPKPEIIG